MDFHKIGKAHWEVIYNADRKANVKGDHKRIKQCFQYKKEAVAFKDSILATKQPELVKVKYL